MKCKSPRISELLSEMVEVASALLPQVKLLADTFPAQEPGAGSSRSWALPVLERGRGQGRTLLPRLLSKYSSHNANRPKKQKAPECSAAIEEVSRRQTLQG